MCVYIAAASGPNGPNEGRLLELLKLRGSNIFGSGMDYPRAKYRTRMCPLNSRVSDRACRRKKKGAHAYAHRVRYPRIPESMGNTAIPT